MAFRKLNEQVELSGFYRRAKGNICEGFLSRFVNKKNGPFFIVQLNKPCLVDSAVIGENGKPKKGKDGKSETVKKTAQSQEYIGVSACATVKPLSEYIGRVVRIEWTGQTESKQYPGKFVQLYQLAVEEPDES